MAHFARTPSAPHSTARQGTATLKVLSLSYKLYSCEKVL
jgi:hypothetical protein